jgi:uncharacterized membrane protein
MIPGAREARSHAMPLLILGLLVWWVSHSFPLVAKGRRDALAARMGESAWKGGFSVVILVSVVLMVIGYRQAEFVNLWFPPVWTMHLNNLLMLIAVGLLGASHSKGNVKRFVRHPMLLAVIVWAVAHLLVNGDLASLVLFGGLGVWAVAAIFMTNARDGAWVKPPPAPAKKDILLVVITVVAFAIIAAIHTLLGHPVFPG